MKLNDLLKEVMISIDDLTSDLKTKKYKQFLELLRDEIESKLDSLEEYDEEESENFESDEYEDYDEE